LESVFTPIGRIGFAPVGAGGRAMPTGMGRGFPLARGARSAPLGKEFAIPSPTFPGITAGVALGVRDSRPLLPSAARPTSPSIHRATPAAPRLLVFRRWVKITDRHSCKTKGTDKQVSIPINLSGIRGGHNVSLSLVSPFFRMYIIGCW